MCLGWLDLFFLIREEEANIQNKAICVFFFGFPGSTFSIHASHPPDILHHPQQLQRPYKTQVLHPGERQCQHYSRWQGDVTVFRWVLVILIAVVSRLVSLLRLFFYIEGDKVELQSTNQSCFSYSTAFFQRLHPGTIMSSEGVSKTQCQIFRHWVFIDCMWIWKHAAYSAGNQ